MQGAPSDGVVALPKQVQVSGFRVQGSMFKVKELRSWKGFQALGAECRVY